MDLCLLIENTSDIQLVGRSYIRPGYNKEVRLLHRFLIQYNLISKRRIHACKYDLKFIKGEGADCTDVLKYYSLTPPQKKKFTIPSKSEYWPKSMTLLIQEDNVSL